MSKLIKTGMSLLTFCMSLQSWSAEQKLIDIKAKCGFLYKTGQLAVITTENGDIDDFKISGLGKSADISLERVNEDYIKNLYTIKADIDKKEGGTLQFTFGTINLNAEIRRATSTTWVIQTNDQSGRHNVKQIIVNLKVSPRLFKKPTVSVSKVSFEYDDRVKK